MYDDFVWMEKFGDPMFHRHVAGEPYSCYLPAPKPIWISFTSQKIAFEAPFNDCLLSLENSIIHQEE